MNKLKEFLYFLIPFLGLGFISVVYFILNTANGASDFKLILSDPFFIITLVSSFIPSIIISLVVVLIYKFSLRFLFKKVITNKKRYIYIFLISIIASILYILIMTKAFDIVNNTIFSLQVGIIVTFIFWTADLIKEKASKKKSSQE
ncbi:MAG: hypothetical protein UHY68_08765 [Acutalibacteraceae bacterium]|nr:hypothetical protein [Acutalibacteraceae bacterium]